MAKEDNGEGAFAECTSLQEILIPHADKLIKDGAYKDITHFTSERLVRPHFVNAHRSMRYRSPMPLRRVRKDIAFFHRNQLASKILCEVIT